MGKLTAGDIEAALGGSCFGCAIAKGRITKPKSLPHDHPSRPGPQVESHVILELKGLEQDNWLCKHSQVEK